MFKSDRQRKAAFWAMRDRFGDGVGFVAPVWANARHIAEEAKLPKTRIRGHTGSELWVRDDGGVDALTLDNMNKDGDEEYTVYGTNSDALILAGEGYKGSEDALDVIMRTSQERDKGMPIFSDGTKGRRVGKKAISRYMSYRDGRVGSNII